MNDKPNDAVSPKPLHAAVTEDDLSIPKRPQTFARPAAEPASPQVVKSLYQPSGHDRYHGIGGLYEIDPDTGSRRPRQPKQ